jgi:MFS family permease
MDDLMSLGQRVYRHLAGKLGGPARVRIIVLLSAVLALDAADMGAVGAMASILQDVFGVDKAQIGLLVAVSSGVGGLAALLFGLLVDRINRVRMLATAVGVWAVLAAVCGAALSYHMLLVVRLALGAAVAATLPAVASLVGDYFPPGDRGRVYGAILSGELVGAGFGLLVAGTLAGIWWRLGFWFLVVPALPLAWAIWVLPEPARGGADRLREGQERLGERLGGQPAGDPAEARLPERQVGRRAREAGVQPRRHLVEQPDPQQKSLLWAFGYVLRIPSNLVLIIGSALGYYFFAGIKTFGVEFMEARFGLSHTMAILALGGLGTGSLVGVFVGGRLSDRLLAQGHLRGRVWVAIGSFLAAALAFLGGLLAVGPWFPFLFLFLGAIALGSVNPPVDAARLDIMHPLLWGRAESIRAILRKSMEAVSPLLLGLLADQVFGGGERGLRDAFLVMLSTLFLSVLVGLIALKTYERDAATADAYARRTFGQKRSG